MILSIFIKTANRDQTLMLWVKAFHIIAVICWFVGIFYLPRLFVHHALSDDQATQNRLKIMERKLFLGIMTPAALVSIALGIWLISFNTQYFMQAAWMHAKLFFILLLIIYHIMCWLHLKRFQSDSNTHSHIFFRWFNEVPTVLLIAIVILVVVRPF